MNAEIYARIAAKQYRDYGFLPEKPSMFIKWGYAIDPKTGESILTESRPYIVPQGTPLEEFLGVLGDIVTVTATFTPMKVGGVNTPTFLMKNPAILAAFKTASSELKVVTYNFKHYANMTKAWKSIVESTKNGPAKFKGSVKDVDSLIKKAWDEGTGVNNEKPWKVYESDEIIGAASGKETKYMRVELTPSTKEVHASPISKADYEKYTKTTD
jgi:hypothetical protein